MAILVEFSPGFKHPQLLLAHHLAHLAGIHLVFVRRRMMLVFIQLHPQIGQRGGRLIIIGDAFMSAQLTLVLIQCTLDIVIHALLPILCPGTTIGIPECIGRGQHRTQLFELNAMGGLGMNGQRA